MSRKTGTSGAQPVREGTRRLNAVRVFSKYLTRLSVLLSGLLMVASVATAGVELTNRAAEAGEKRWTAWKHAWVRRGERLKAFFHRPPRTPRVKIVRWRP